MTDKDLSPSACIYAFFLFILSFLSLVFSLHLNKSEES